LVPVLLFLWQGDLGWNWSDEGLHWLQIRRVLHGGDPSADLHAYAPGRYLWGALFALLRPDSLLAVRFASVPFMALGILAGLWTLRRRVTRPLDRILLSLVLSAWMFPHYKVYDCAISLLAVGFAARLAAHPDRRNALLAGGAAGLFGFIGENHALYAMAAFAATLGVLGIRSKGVRTAPLFLSLGSGFLLGLVPYAVHGLLHPASLGQRIAYLFTVRAGSLPTPVPWPWTVRLAAGDWGSVAALARGAGFVLIPLFYLGVLLRLFRRDRRAGDPGDLPVPAVLVGLIYLRHAFSRPDPEHFAQGAGPFFVAAASLAGLAPGRWRSWVLPLLMTYTLAAVATEHPGVQACREAAVAPRTTHRVGRDILRLDANAIEGLAIVDRVVKGDLAPGRPLLALPALSMVYAVHDLTPPIQGTYFLS
jgi:hypothetical protein